IGPKESIHSITNPPPDTLVEPPASDSALPITNSRDLPPPLGTTPAPNHQPPSLLTVPSSRHPKPQPTPIYEQPPTPLS
ncbi:hypothetical protein A2U01_0066114, partial [Trifolium medium]|nr:hypothetical protein [Trifolium medium]